MNPVNSTNTVTTPTFLNTSTDSELDLTIVSKSSEMFLYDNCKTDNKLARVYLHFLTDGETLESVERLKEEDISPDELWNLIQNTDNLLSKVKNP